MPRCIRANLLTVAVLAALPLGACQTIPRQSSANAAAEALPAEVRGLLTEVQRAGVRYFYDFGHPESGLAREYSDRRPEVCAIGATGMGLFNLIVAAERGWVPREEVAGRVRLMLRFLATKADRFHGAFPHWLDGRTGKTVPFGPDDDGGDLVETAFLAQGLIAVREYFTGSDAVETEVRTRADRIWREIEWDWYVRETPEGKAYLVWHWSPRVGFRKNQAIRGFNECQIAYLLALGSPTHGVPARVYREGWLGSGYTNPREEFGIKVVLGRSMAMPLFFTYYSYLGFDPRALKLEGRTYFEHFQDLCRVQVAYAQSKSGTFKGYGPLWGLTASLGPEGYRAFAPGARDNGTIAPTAALSAFPYVPEESSACLLELQRHYRERLWGPYGYKDAFNPTRGWVANGYLGIDVGPIAPMIENYLSGLCWRVFMKAPEVRVMVDSLH